MNRAEDTTEVVVLVLRNRADDGDRYLIARQRDNDFWEFVGGKVKKDEQIEEAAMRELEDEIHADWSESEVEIAGSDGSYESPDNPVYDLHPVLIDVDPEKAWDLGDEDLGEEHDSLAWVTVDQLDDYKTAEQKKTLEALGLL